MLISLIIIIVGVVVAVFLIPHFRSGATKTINNSKDYFMGDKLTIPESAPDASSDDQTPEKVKPVTTNSGRREIDNFDLSIFKDTDE